VDVDRNKRAFISDDGKLTDIHDNVIGFINDDGSAGDVNENFLGEINDDGQVSTADNTLIGSVDMGTAEMRNENGSHFATISNSGEIYDGIDGFRGKVTPFTFHKLRIITAYIFFFDQNIVDPTRPTKLKSITPPVKPEAAPAATKDTVPTESEPAVTLPMPVKPTPAAQHTPDPTPVRKVSVEDREYKEYKVGEFKTLSDGNLLEISNCDCPVSQLSVRLEKQGTQVVFQRTIQTNHHRKQQAQRFTMPYVLSTKRITVKYDHGRDGGTLSLTFRKPEGGASTGGQSGQFTKYIIPAVSGSDGKVTIKASQAKDHFVFEPTGEPKLETEIIGEIEGGDIKFHAITTNLEAGERKKATQSFSLGTTVLLGQIDLENNGKKVLVYPKRSVAASHSQTPSEPIPDDTDIPIH
jgi:hypothetical protein